MRTYAELYGEQQCMLTYADVCRRMRTYADVCGRMRTYAELYGEQQWQGVLAIEQEAMLAGAQFTCFTSTKVQILTQHSSSEGGAGGLA